MSGTGLVDDAIFSTLLAHGSLSVPGLARELALPPSTANGILQRLVDEGRVGRTPASSTRAPSPGRGRPALRYRPQLPQPVAACILDGSSLTLAVLDRDLTLLAREDQRFQAATHPAPAGTAAGRDATAEVDRFWNRLTRSLTDACKSAGIERDRLAGLALSANVLTMTHGVVSSSVLPWVGEQAMNQCRAAMKLEVHFVEHAHLLAAYQATPTPRPRLMVRFNVGDGVSAHHLAGGWPHAGASGMAGELGHVIIDPEGPTCGCGRRGCLEALTSGPAIRRALLERATPAIMTRLDRQWLARTPPSQAFDAIYDAWLAGDGAVVSVMDHVLEQLAQGLGMVINMLDPDLVVTTGYVLAEHPRWLEQFEQRTRRWVFRLDRRDLRLVPGQASAEQVLRVAALSYFYPSCFTTPHERPLGQPT